MNPILQSEGFEQAAHTLSRVMRDCNLPAAFDSANQQLLNTVNEFGRITNEFGRKVDKLVTAMGMQAENEWRTRNGQSIAYGEAAFNSLE